jgi:hypothetical protein
MKYGVLLFMMHDRPTDCVHVIERMSCMITCCVMTGL